jgi:imidazolonepropionase-like amidohydrolase
MPSWRHSFPRGTNFGWMLELSPEERKAWRDSGTAHARDYKQIVAAGSDDWNRDRHLADSHRHSPRVGRVSLAGLSPTQAIQAGTAGAARILGAENDLGTIEAGKWADLVFLDGRSARGTFATTRRIWNVMQYGRLIDSRPTVLKVCVPRWGGIGHFGHFLSGFPARKPR